MVQTSIDFSWTILDQDLQPARQPIECIFCCFFHKNKTISRRRYQNRGLGAGTSTPFFWHLIEQGGVSKLQTQRVPAPAARALGFYVFQSLSTSNWHRSSQQDEGRDHARRMCRNGGPPLRLVMPFLYRPAFGTVIDANVAARTCWPCVSTTSDQKRTHARTHMAICSLKQLHARAIR
jgi:hypothetical protein